MAGLDYSIPMGASGPLFGDSVLEAIDARRRREAEQRRLDIEERRQRASEAFTRAQAAATQRAQDERDRRDRMEFQQKQARQRFLDTQAIAKALGGGQFGLAQGLAASSQYEDPRTGQLGGVQLAQKPLGPAPGPAPQAPAEPQAPAFVGPLETPEGARARAMAAGLGAPGATQPPAFQAQTPEQTAAGDAAALEVSQLQGERDDYAKAREAFPQQQQQFETDRKGYDKRVADYEQEKANPRFSIGFPGGQSVDIDPREARLAAAAEARDTAGRLRAAAAAPGQPPDVVRSMLLQASLIESQVANADKAPVTGMASQVQAQGARASESALDRASREKVAAQRKTKAMGNALGAGGGQGLAELIKMKEDGRSDSEIAARAAELRIPAGGKTGWLQATKEVTRGAAAEGRAQEQKSALAVYDPRSGAYLGDAPNAQRAKSTADELHKVDDVANVATALKEHVQAQGTVAPFGLTQASRDRKALAESLVTSISSFKNLGAISKDDRIIVDGVISGGVPAVLGMNESQLDLLLAAIERTRTSALRSQGIGTQGTAQRVANAPPGVAKGMAPNQKVKMPDGTVAEFDSSGRRVK